MSDHGRYDGKREPESITTSECGRLAETSDQPAPLTAEEIARVRRGELHAHQRDFLATLDARDREIAALKARIDALEQVARQVIGCYRGALTWAHDDRIQMSLSAWRGLQADALAALDEPKCQAVPCPLCKGSGKEPTDAQS